MAEIANTLWYRLGNVTVTDGSTKVTGVGTHWTTAGINPGATLRVDGKYLAHEVKRVVSDTEIELGAAYYGGSTSGAAYSIDRNFQSTTNAKLAADVTDVIGLYEQVRDGTMPMIEGKSAYQVAVANGFIGTEAQWVESLKSAGEIVTINSKLDRLYINNAAAHNSHYRGKNLGTAITPEQIAAIRNGTFDDLYPGDRWVFTIDGKYVRADIMHLQLFGYKVAVVLLTCSDWQFPFNDTADCSGGLVNSKLQTEVFPELLEKITAVIPDDYLYSLSLSMCDAVNSDGVPTHSINTTTKLLLPSPYNIGLRDEVNDTKSAYGFLNKIRWAVCNFTMPMTDNTYTSWMACSASGSQWYAHSLWMPTIGPVAANSTRHVAPYILLG